MHKVFAIIHKEFTEYFRERVILLTYVLSLTTMFVMGFGMNFDAEHVRTIIVDNDKTPLSMRFQRQFYNTKYFDSKTMDLSFDESLKMIKTNRADLLVFIPLGFERDIVKGDAVSVGVYIDGSFPIMSKTIDGYLKAGLQQFIGRESFIESNVIVEARYLFNQSMKTRWAIIPGCIALIMLMVPAIFSALMVVKEKERGTIFNFYSSHLRRSEFILGKVIPAFISNIGISFMMFFLATYVFGLPFKGSFFVYLLASILFLVIAIGIGFFISVITETQIAAIILAALVTAIPGYLYSGITSPVDSMEGVAFYIAHMYPIMYYVKIMYDCFLIGDGLGSPNIRLYLLILGGFIFVIYLVNYLLLRKKI